MSVYSGPEIPNNGLVCMLDASNPKSYNPNLVTVVGASNCPFNGEVAAVSLDTTPVGTTELCKHTLTGLVSPFMNVRVDRSLNAGTYTMSAWVRATTSFSASFAYVGETTNEIYANTAAITPTWTRFTLTFTLIATQTNSRLQIFFGTQGNDKIISVWGCELLKGLSPTAYYIDSNYRGTTWQDLTGNGYDATLVASPAYNNGVMNFNGTTQYAYNNMNLSTGTSTIIAGARYSGAIRNRVIGSITGNYLLGYYSNGSNYYYANGWVLLNSPVASDLLWRIYAGTADVTADVYSLYNGNTLLASNNGGTGGVNGLQIGGGYNTTTELSTCEVSFVLAYNRVLTAGEVSQVFNAYRGRFGI